MTSKKINKEPKIKVTKSSRLINTAEQAGIYAGKITALDQINRSKNIPKQLNDLAQDAWEHDGIPALEDVATEEEWDSIYGAETCDAFTVAFIETLTKRLKR